MMILPFFCVLNHFVSSQHVWNVFIANTQSSCQLANVYEYSANFVDTQNNSINGFVTNDNYFKFGLVLSVNATFNMIYSLTCAETNCVNVTDTKLTCPRIVFVIGAFGPAVPIITIVNYELAIGKWNVSNNQIMLQIIFP